MKKYYFLIIVVIVIAAVIGGLWLKGKIITTGQQLEKPPFMVTSFKSKKDIKVKINGKLDEATINPSYVDVKAGQLVAIQTDGQILEKPYIGKYSVLSPTKIIKVVMPGEKEEYRLNSQMPTEFRTKNAGQIKFSIDRAHLPGTKFATGKLSGSKFEKGSVKISLFFMKNPSGKGGPLRKINEREVFSTGIKRFVPLPKNKYPNFDLIKKAEKGFDEIKQGVKSGEISKSVKEDGLQIIEKGGSLLKFTETDAERESREAKEKTELQEDQSKMEETLNNLKKSALEKQK
ncbi:MAG: hypothetical protein ABIE43_04705 [Patescibacteria group bacterium]